MFYFLKNETKQFLDFTSSLCKFWIYGSQNAERVKEGNGGLS